MHWKVSPFSLFYVYDSCEKNLDWHYGRAEWFGIVSSFSFMLAYLVGNFVIKQHTKNQRFVKSNHQLPQDFALFQLQSVVIISFTSSIYHLFLSPLSQLLDEIGVIQAQLAYLYTFKPLTLNEKRALWICLCVGLVNPVPLGLFIFYLFWLINRTLIKLAKEYPELKVLAQWIILTNVIASLSGLLDYLTCPSYELLKLHSVGFHILLSVYCFLGSIFTLKVKQQMIVNDCMLNT